MLGMVPGPQGVPCTVVLGRILRNVLSRQKPESCLCCSGLGEKSPGKHKPFHLFLSVCVAFSRCKFGASSAFDFQDLERNDSPLLLHLIGEEHTDLGL